MGPFHGLFFLTFVSLDSEEREWLRYCELVWLGDGCVEGLVWGWTDRLACLVFQYVWILLDTAVVMQGSADNMNMNG